MKVCKNKGGPGCPEVNVLPKIEFVKSSLPMDLKFACSMNLFV